MALVKCSECGKDVSTKAASCPNCGAPVKRKSGGCGTIVFILLMVGLLTAIIPTCSQPAAPSPASVAPAPIDRAKIRAAAEARFVAEIEQKHAELLRAVESNDYIRADQILRQFENFNKRDYRDVASLATRIRTSAILERVSKLSTGDNKGRAEAFAELAALHPENSDYIEQAKRHRQAWDEEQAILAEQQKIEAKKRAAEEAERNRKLSRQRAIEQQFSAWNGAHRGLERFIKASMNDPDSYKHVESRYIDHGDYLVVTTTFRGKNVFGGVVTNSVRAKFTLSGELIEILSQH